MTAHETATVLRHGFQDRDGHPTLTLDPAFQGLPAMAHGGSVLGAFDLLAGLGGPRTLTSLYRRRVPLGVPLALDVTRAPAEVRYQLAHGGELLVEGHVRAGGAEPPAASARPLDVEGYALPVSRTCFACGTDNPLGLRLTLHVDDGAVHGRWQPSARFFEGSGHLASVALTTLLDEAAFWLGALATGESGMTTDLRVTVYRPARAETALTVRGERRDVGVRQDDARYRDTRVAVLDDDGVLASGAITFVAVRGAARRLVSGLLAMNDVASVRRVFPRYL